MTSVGASPGAKAAAVLALLAVCLAAACLGRKEVEPPFDPKRGGLRPAQAMARMKLAPGFAVSLFAAEPQVRQPVAMNWDDRGRMWVVEYIQYPDPAGLRALEWDRYFRTKYDRVPEPPPRGPRGADRIKILEDTDGDGRADRIKVFVDGLNLASGVAVGYGGVYVAQAPYLLFYPDRNGDDVPDGPPEVLLEGFGLEDAHAVVNSLTWGPDGWLYGAQGSTVTAHIRGLTFQQGIWRYHPITREFELFAEGGGNTWSFDWDSKGQLLCGTNFSNYAMLHMVQGGYYVKTFEKHGPLSNPYAFGYFPHCEHRGPFKGMHVTIGGLTYQADAYPESFRGKHIAANILSNAIYWFDVEPHGSTFATRNGGDLLTTDDSWFRPVDLTTGPDGCVYVADWYDLRATHNNTREDTWDKTSGRIYRIDYAANAGRMRREKLRLGREPSAKLVDRLRHPNEWFHREARRILAERRDQSVIPQLRTDLFAETDDHRALECLWALYASGGLDEPTAARLLRHASAPVRMWCVRLLGDARGVSSALATELAALAARETDVAVRSQLAASARRLPPKVALEILEPLVARDADSGDPHIPLLLWWALERHVRDQRDEVVALLSSPAAWRSNLARRHLHDRLARRLVSSGGAADFAAGARLLASAPDPEGVDVVCRGMDLGLAARSFERPPPELVDVLARLWSRTERSDAVVRLAARLGNAAARQRARAVVFETRPAPERVAMIDLLGQVGGSENLGALGRLLARVEPDAVAIATIKALGRFSEPKAADILLGRLAALSGRPRENALDLLASRPEWAERMIRSLGEAFRKEPLSLVQKILQHGNPRLDAMVEKSWGRVAARGSPEKAQHARQLAGIVGPPDLFTRPGRSYDRAHGKDLFAKRCARCHTLFGEGGSIGPDLTGAERRNIDVLMLSIIDPSASIRGEFASFNVEMKDGRILAGFVTDPTPQAFVVLDSAGEKTFVARADVREVRESPLSLMPEGLLDDLDPQSLVDFFSYLTAPSRPGR